MSQIANLFQRRPADPPPDIPVKENTPTVPTPGSGMGGGGVGSGGGGSTVVRTESHAARFNHARALFERLGEGKVNMQSGFSIKHSTSKDDNLKDAASPDNADPVSPKIKYIKITNGVSKIDTSKIHNVSRIKMEKPEKPEKPERKFNSRELIEKQKNWTSHFSKTKNAKPHSDFNRCDIIRAPILGGSAAAVKKPDPELPKPASFEEIEKELPKQSPTKPPKPPKLLEKLQQHSSVEKVEIEHIPVPPHRRDSLGGSGPEENGRKSRRGSYDRLEDPESPDEAPQPPSHFADTLPSPPEPPVREESIKPAPPDVPRKQPSLDDDDSARPEYRRLSSTSENNSVCTGPISPVHQIGSSSPGISAASDPASPVHTEDEKQENEETEKKTTEEGKCQLLT